MSWMYDDASLAPEPQPESEILAHVENDFELFHETITPIDETSAELPVVVDQGIKHVRVR